METWINSLTNKETIDQVGLDISGFSRRNGRVLNHCGKYYNAVKISEYFYDQRPHSLLWKIVWSVVVKSTRNHTISFSEQAICHLPITQVFIN